MQIQEPPALTIWGSAAPKVFELLKIENQVNKNERWLFLDYALATISLNTEFVTTWEKKTQSSLQCEFRIKILECVDGYGTILPEVPQGWKSFRKIEFQPYIPEEINNLPELMGWGYSNERVKLDLTELKK